MGTIRVSEETSKRSNSQFSQSTTSTSRTETVNGYHEFKITGYSLSKGMGIGKYIASDTFVVGAICGRFIFTRTGKASKIMPRGTYPDWPNWPTISQARVFGGDGAGSGGV
ncbi:unnamed protein product [Ilex paraguariensis]|uniref:Uncharacterized protein n=1 Tax=Ilex paraguariensis TaxID=185542 RepID=A0ABC8U024_9AQUA